jgi:peroxiredoxin Q/BCP
VSKDSEERHASFRSTLDLPFPLLSDEGSKIAKAFGLTRAGGWLPSKRATFVIDSDGIVNRAITAELDIAEHVRESLKALEELAA